MFRNLMLSLIVLTVLASAAAAQVHVNGYTRRDGTSVQPHYRSTPDQTPQNNWSTRGNVNPYTGQVGTRDPGSQPGAGPYQTPLLGQQRQSLSGR